MSRTLVIWLESCNLQVKFFPCENCSKSFSSGSKLKQHMLVHRQGSHFLKHQLFFFLNLLFIKKSIKFLTGKYSFNLSKIWSNKNDVKTVKALLERSRTLWIWSEERPYACTMCNRAFNVVSNLRRHIRTIHKDVTMEGLYGWWSMWFFSIF